MIPTYKPGKKFQDFENAAAPDLACGEDHRDEYGEIIWNEHGFGGIKNLEVHHLTKEEFDHGETRNRGMRFSRADIVVFMTDDAVPAR